METLSWSVFQNPLAVIIIIAFTNLALEGVHKRLGLYNCKVLTHSQGNLEAKGEPRTTNMGQIMDRINLLQGWIELNRRPPGDRPGTVMANPVTYLI